MEKFEAAKMEIVEFEAEDIITTSSGRDPVPGVIDSPTESAPPEFY